jgi:hypothetical protein
LKKSMSNVHVPEQYLYEFSPRFDERDRSIHIPDGTELRRVGADEDP